MLTKGQLTAIICCACVGAGLAFVRIVQHQEQQNDQSQNTVVNTITKTVVVNYSSSDKKYKNIKWKRKMFDNQDDLYHWFLDDMNEWQRETAKIYYHEKLGLSFLLYRQMEVKPIVYTNNTVVSNDSRSVNTNSFEIRTIWSRLKGAFGK